MLIIPTHINIWLKDRDVMLMVMNEDGNTVMLLMMLMAMKDTMMVISHVLL